LHANLEAGWSPAGRAEVRHRAYRSDEFRDAFLVLNANRNQPRKRIDLTLAGFALFAQGKPANVRLHLHMGLEDLGWDLPTLAERHGVAERLIFSTRSRRMPGVGEDELNLIYNACDVGLNTATSEGWGLVSFEHAATGAAQIVPDHSVLGELWRGRAEMLPPSLTLVDPTTQGEESFVAPEAVAAALERLYADRGHLDALSRAAYAHATRDAYRWPAISARWHHLLTACLAESIRA
jgi:glycosyltransferase involved in cell wall biosynthesis